jgi:serine/threonine-protein kinase RsbW/stage II sporulation protein AB (anti-sigma F factor)
MPSSTWTAPATPESVPALRARAMSYAHEQRVAEPPIGDLKLALCEAISNAVVHAFRNQAPGTITVSVAVDPSANEVKAVVIDDGCGMRPNPDSPGLGLGMPLIGALADSMEVRLPETGHGTEVCMTFHVPVVDG